MTLDGRFHSADDAVLLPPPARPVPLMIGSNGPRMLGIALPHVDAWNTWFDDYGNTAEGFARAERHGSAAPPRSGARPGGDRAQRVRARGAGRRPAASGAAGVAAAHRAAGADRGALRELAEAGADEAILVVDPITERSIRALADVVALVA